MTFSVNQRVFVPHLVLILMSWPSSFPPATGAISISPAAFLPFSDSRTVLR